jgi:arylsulfatase A-like enzyme
MNFIVIVSDTVRLDHLGCYGGTAVRTPALDALAAQSVIFDRCYVSSFPTIPHRNDCFMGRYSFPFTGWGPLPTGAPSLAEVLGGAGYVTQLIHDTPHLRSGVAGYQRGFQGYHWNRGQEADCEFTHANARADGTADALVECSPEKNRSESAFVRCHRLNRLGYPGELGHHSARTALDVCHWLEHNYKAERFFLWVDMFDPHEPWDAPDWLIESYYQGAPGCEKVRNPRYDDCGYLTPDELAWSHAAYCAELALVDKWVGEIIRKVGDLGLLEDTAIVFTSDHGFLHGEHGRIGKHTLVDDPWPLYEEIAREPLLIRLPDGPRGVHRDQLVQPVDLRPTLLDLCGVTDPAPGHGKSLGRILDGADVRLREIALSASCITDRASLFSRATVTHEDGWSLILGSPTQPPELYYLPDDPAQAHNRFETDPMAGLELGAMFRAALSFLGTPDAVSDQWRNL